MARPSSLVPRPMSLGRAHAAESAATPHERHAGIIILYYVVLIVFQKKNSNCSLQKDMETELARISLKHGDQNVDCLPSEGIMEKAHAFSLQTRSLLEKEFWRRPMRLTCKLLAVARKNGLVGCITTWNMCSAGKRLCTSVDRSKNYALLGGKGVELNLWDLENCSKIWTAEPPPSNSLCIFYPTWLTTATFLSEDIEKLWLGRTIISTKETCNFSRLSRDSN